MILYQRAKLEDCTYIFQCEQEIFHQGLSYDTLKEDVLYHSQSEYIVAKDERKPIGYIGALVVGHQVDIINLYVEPDYRRQGVATQLFKTLLNSEKEISLTDITLDVKENNHVAISLYKKIGFSVIGKRKQYYQDGSNALVMKHTRSE
ncbi:MAG: ribosomal protein S18-alanine N-acetyltransferase [Candidatus Izemoplasma sp.]|nr:ribosomal protein S18-alanine N-acetyltransferase [Candidatus Izemoplasma sp.]